MSDPVSLFSPLNDALSFLSDPSILHWQAVFFGEWVYGVFDSKYPINYPVSAVMVSLASLNIVALAGLLIVLFMTGGKALLSGLVTADIATGTSKFVPVRLLMAFGLLMPTHAGIDALDDFNISISNVQVNTMRLILMGGATADWVWLKSAKALFDFNIGGAPTLRNTVERSNEFAIGFVCNELYYQTRGSNAGEPLFSYMLGDEDTPTSLSDVRGASSFSDISLPAPNSKKQYLAIMLGGKSSKCGVINFSILPDPAGSGSSASGTQFKQLVAEIPMIEFLMRQASNSIMLSALAPYADFASRYYQDFGSISIESIFDARGESDFVLEPQNIGGLQAGGGDVNAKVNATGDALIYLAQNLSYSQQGVTHSALSSFGSYLSASNGSLANTPTSLSERVFDRYLSGYVSAGMFWSMYQDFAALSYDAERYANELKMDLADLTDSAKLCEDSIFGWFGSTEVGGVEFRCDTIGHLNVAFPSLTSVASEKASQKQMASTIATPQGNFGVDVGIWSGFYKSRSATSELELGFWATIFVDLFEVLWHGMSVFDLGNNGSLMGSGAATRGSLLSGTDAMLLNLTGSNSPYIMLTQLGEGMRDVAFLVEFTRSTLAALSDTATGTLEKVNASILNKAPFLAPITIIPEFIQNLTSNLLGWAIAVLAMLVKALNSTALILIYALPSIPVFGWVMILLAMIFTSFAAMAATPFAAILIGLPKGEGVFSPDTERVLSLLYGVFIRQPMTVVGFMGSIAMGYIGMSILNLVWFSTFFSKLAGVSTLDSIFFVVFIIIGYGVCLFFVCMYSFRVTSMLNDVVGSWISTHIIGAFGSHEADNQAAISGIQGLSQQLDDLSGSFSDFKKDKDKDKDDKTGKDKNDPSKFNA